MAEPEHAPRSWVEAARRGDAEALARLFDHLRPRLAAYARRRLGERARRWTDSESIAARSLEEVLGAPERLPPGADEDELLRRLYRTALTRIYDATRNHRRDAGESVLPAGDPAAAARSSGPVTVADTQRYVRALVERLPDAYAEVVRLCALEELSYVEAGRRLGVSADAVRKRYERARRLIAERVEGADG